MTAEPVGPAKWAPNPVRQRERDYSLEDVLDLPEEAPRVELDNGVVIAVEVVSPGTRRRDRLEKPALYACAGVPHFWRIEQDPAHVFAYDLVDGKYDLVADATEEPVLHEPFEIKLPIRDITP